MTDVGARSAPVVRTHAAGDGAAGGACRRDEARARPARISQLGPVGCVWLNDEGHSPPLQEERKQMKRAREAAKRRAEQLARTARVAAADCTGARRRPSLHIWLHSCLPPRPALTPALSCGRSGGRRPRARRHSVRPARPHRGRRLHREQLSPDSRRRPHVPAVAAGARVDQLYGLTRLGRRSTWTRTRTRTTTPRATTTRSSTRRAVESDDDEQLSLTPMEEME